MESRYVWIIKRTTYITCSFVETHCARRRCHLGKSIIYDTISNLSWPSDVRTHTIQTVIQRLLNDPWPPALDVGREVPEAIAEEDCVVSLLPLFLFTCGYIL